ncbi:MAG: MBL fold metallo-hydrolase [Promethearchaeota archaeon]
MVKIKFLGACHEVGRSGVLITSEITGDAILCDYGTMMDGDQLFPAHVSGKDLSAIILTHSHIDHCGGLPLFYISGSVPLYTTELTYQVSEILLQDMLNIGKSYLPFDKAEIYKMRKYARFLKYGERKHVGKKTWITLINAGHIPGSAMALIEMDGKKILYTGDFNTIPTQLLNPAKPEDIPPIDAIITETTYGNKTHPDRKVSEKELLETIGNVVSKQGTVLIPAFGVARSQEILMILNRDGNSGISITVDGMARKIASLYMEFPSKLRDPQNYLDSLDNSHFINQRRRDAERSAAASKPGVVVAPSGMLKGGTSRYYFEKLMNDSKNSVVLVSYQVENTPGYILLEKGVYIKNRAEEESQVAAQVKHLDFSSHIDQPHLIEFLEKLTFIGEKRVFCIHGDEQTMMNFEESIKSKGFITDLPEMEQEFIV